MILLTSTSDKLQLVTGNSGASVDVNTSYVDKDGDVYTPLRNNVVDIITATTTDIVTSPAAGVQRNVKGVNIRNVSGNATQVTLQHTDGTNIADLFSVLLLQGETVSLDEKGVWRHYDNQGGEYVPNMPNDYMYGMGVSGTISESIPRFLCNEVNLSALVSGTLLLVGIYLRAGQKITNILVSSATTAANTPTNQIFGLYDYQRNLLAQTINYTTEAWASNTLKTRPLVTPYVVQNTGFHYIGILVTATTVPSLKGNTGKSGNSLASIAPVLHGFSTGGLTTTLPNPAANVTSSSSNPVWCAVT